MLWKSRGLVVPLVFAGFACSSQSPGAYEAAPPAPECGDGVRLDAEQCDGVDLAGESCLSAGYDGGVLACDASCSFDFSGCSGTGPACGNGVAEGLEQCDGEDLREATCSTAGFEGGLLACSAACAFDTSGCTGEAPVCGDDNAEGLEECDGPDLRQLDCAQAGFAAGALACDATCRLDTSGCTGDSLPFCGDGSAEGLEQCDGEDLRQLDCASLGYESGELACDASCVFDVAACTGSPAVCGNDVREALEECDGSDLASAECADLGYAGGTLACDSSCTFDPSGCTSPVCGNGVLETGEACDSSDLGGEDCLSLGLGEGALACAIDCTFDTSACTTPVCGDGAVNQESEACDGEALDGESCRSLSFQGGQLLCNDDCTFDTFFCWGTTATCGDGELDLSEECEGTSLGDATCESLGFTGGELACTADCTFDTSGCTGEGPACGDGVAEGDEMCDGDDLRDLACDDFGFTGGALVCTAQCTLSFASCTSMSDPVCGDDQAERGELCDGSDLRGESCASLNAGTGDLACNETCDGYDFSLCSSLPVCGNDVVEGGEVCDGTDLDGVVSCASFGYRGTEAVSCLPTCAAYDLSLCTGAAGRCGDSHVQGGEQCDGSELGGASCISLGYSSGDLSCRDNCSFDVSLCVLD